MGWRFTLITSLTALLAVFPVCLTPVPRPLPFLSASGSFLTFHSPFAVGTTRPSDEGVRTGVTDGRLGVSFRAERSDEWMTGSKTRGTDEITNDRGEPKESLPISSISVLFSPRSGRNLSRSSLSHLVPHHRHSFPATRRLRRNDGGMGDESGASGIGVKW